MWLGNRVTTQFIDFSNRATFFFAYLLDVDFTVQFPETHLLHETVKLNCAGSEDVKPEPNVQLWIGFENQQHRSLANSTFQVSFDYELEFEDDGGYFYCITEQSGGSGIYFQDKESSDFINLVYGPILDVENHMDYVFVNESITLPITFFAKPMPRIEDGITWQILNRDVIQIMQAGDVRYPHLHNIYLYLYSFVGRRNVHCLRH